MNKSMKFGMTCIITLLLSYSTKAQPMRFPPLEFIYNKVYKNIAAYNIRFADYNYNGSIVDSPFKDTKYFFYDDYLPEEGWRLQMEIKESQIQYPIKGFKVYEIELNGLRYVKSDSTRLKGGKNPGRYFLVACDHASQRVKFISGRFFLSAISDDFKVNMEDTDSVLKYLNIRLYSLQITDMNIRKKQKNKIECIGFSTLYQSNVKVILHSNNIEYPEIIKLKNFN